MNTERLRSGLFGLLRCELWGERLPDGGYSAKDYLEIFAEARRQAVAGIVAQVLIDNNVALGAKGAMEVFGSQNQTRQRNAKINDEMGKFCSFLSRHGVKYVVVKGQTVAQSYRHPLARQSGDVDFYCDAENYGKAKALIEKQLGISLENFFAEKHVEFKAGDVAYEMHSLLADFSSARHQRYWEDALAKELAADIPFVDVNGVSVPTLSPTMNALYLFVHIFHHLIVSGIGLRQFCDWAVWLHSYKDEIDREALKRHLEGLGLLRAYRVLGVVLVDYLGLPADDFPLEISDKDRRRCRKVLQNIFRMGNFGHSVKTHTKRGPVHVMETAWVALSQSVRFVNLAPSEVLPRIPKMIVWHLKR